MKPTMVPMMALMTVNSILSLKAAKRRMADSHVVAAAVAVVVAAVAVVVTVMVMMMVLTMVTLTQSLSMAAEAFLASRALSRAPLSSFSGKTELLTACITNKIDA